MIFMSVSTGNGTTMEDEELIIYIYKFYLTYE